MTSMIFPNNNNPISGQQASGKKREVSVDMPTRSAEQVKMASIPSTVGERVRSDEEAIQELQKAINAIQGPQKTFEISVHEKTHAIMIKVLNKDTGELIREVPPEKILDLAAHMMEITGIIVDEKV